MNTDVGQQRRSDIAVSDNLDTAEQNNKDRTIKYDKTLYGKENNDNKSINNKASTNNMLGTEKGSICV